MVPQVEGIAKTKVLIIKPANWAWRSGKVSDTWSIVKKKERKKKRKKEEGGGERKREETEVMFLNARISFPNFSKVSDND